MTANAKGVVTPTDPTEDYVAPDFSGMTEAAVERYMTTERRRFLAADLKARTHRANYLRAADELVRQHRRPVQAVARLLELTQQSLRDNLGAFWSRLGVDFSPDRRADRPAEKREDLEAAGWESFTTEDGEERWFLPGRRGHDAEDFPGLDLNTAWRSVAYPKAAAKGRTREPAGASA